MNPNTEITPEVMSVQKINVPLNTSNRSSGTSSIPVQQTSRNVEGTIFYASSSGVKTLTPESKEPVQASSPAINSREDRPTPRILQVPKNTQSQSTPSKEIASSKNISNGATSSRTPAIGRTNNLSRSSQTSVSATTIKQPQPSISRATGNSKTPIKSIQEARGVQPKRQESIIVSSSSRQALPEIKEDPKVEQQVSEFQTKPSTQESHHSSTTTSPVISDANSQNLGIKSTARNLENSSSPSQSSVTSISKNSSTPKESKKQSSEKPVEKFTPNYRIGEMRCFSSVYENIWSQVCHRIHY
ncbi:hypothetical protein MSUIS_06990 [Mycoplasma suis KI3806]|uniref:Uncharacterized protein n=1 Tax=Mycoplasma suis (strain KI_3806) TaxID=708248 RepID=F0V2B1_MYCS3|nr:hypothetical protein [Mycoplasma suis]CBZ40792.1 hypothetical protein MSUIS_06990 [Mycoplasma suis KI3806]